MKDYQSRLDTIYKYKEEHKVDDKYWLCWYRDMKDGADPATNEEKKVDDARAAAERHVLQALLSGSPCMQRNGTHAQSKSECAIVRKNSGKSFLTTTTPADCPGAGHCCCQHAGPR